MVLILSHLYTNYHFDPSFAEVVSNEDKIKKCHQQNHNFI